MNKNEFVSAVAEKTGLTKKAAASAVDAALSTIEEALLNGDKIQFVGFGTFETKKRNARTGKNPRKPDEVVEIPAKTVPSFKAGKSLKDKIANI